MAKLPEIERMVIPEGDYVFEITEAQVRQKEGTKIRWFQAYFKVKDLNGSLVRGKFFNAFFPSEEKRYRELLFALGAPPDEKGIPHGRDVDTDEIIGISFKASIIHELDKKDTTITRDKIMNIQHDNKPDKPYEEEVPF